MYVTGVWNELLSDKTGHKTQTLCLRGNKQNKTKQILVFLFSFVSVCCVTVITLNKAENTRKFTFTYQVALLELSIDEFYIRYIEQRC